MSSISVARKKSHDMPAKVRYRKATKQPRSECLLRRRSRMKRVTTKMFGIIGLLIDFLIVVGFGVLILLCNLPSDPIHQGTGLAWMAILFLLVYVSLLFYLVDGIFSLVKSCRRIDPVFNTVLFLTALLANICGFGALCALQIDSALITRFPEIFLRLGAALHLAIPALEIISIDRLVKKRR